MYGRTKILMLKIILDEKQRKKERYHLSRNLLFHYNIFNI